MGLQQAAKQKQASSEKQYQRMAGLRILRMMVLPVMGFMRICGNCLAKPRAPNKQKQPAAQPASSRKQQAAAANGLGGDKQSSSTTANIYI